jgi:hypothetical protein
MVTVRLTVMVTVKALLLKIVMVTVAVLPNLITAVNVMVAMWPMIVLLYVKVDFL